MDNSIVSFIVIGSSVAFIFTGLAVAGYKLKQWHDRLRPPFCSRCGISYHAPKEEVRQSCPHNPLGTSHFFPGITPEPEPMIAWGTN